MSPKAPPPAPAAARPTDDELAALARGARDRAYAPYSNYLVGCALVVDGETFVGANVENASYGLAMCAERTAMARAVVEGRRGLEVVAVATQSSPPAPPCGMCRQTLIEFAADPAKVRVILTNPAGEIRVHTLAELLPHGFTPSQLDG